MKKGGKMIAALVTASCFIAVAWLSCTKTTSSPSCKNVVCQNHGSCTHDTVLHVYKCLCPSGYEGKDCSVVSADKYLGAWDMTQTVVGTDSPAFKNYVFHYIVYLNQSPTPTTFLITNWSGNQYYSNIICTLDSMNSFHFVIDTLSSWHLVYDHYKITSGSGTISHNDSLVSGNMITRHLSATSNWINDTFVFYATRHNN